MPYVTPRRRAALDNYADSLNVGELTYQVTSCLVDYLAVRASDKPRLTYAHVAECLAALAGAEHDLVRRVLTPLEQAAQARNGDVWPQDVLRAVGTVRSVTASDATRGEYELDGTVGLSA